MEEQTDRPNDWAGADDRAEAAEPPRDAATGETEGLPHATKIFTAIAVVGFLILACGAAVYGVFAFGTAGSGGEEREAEKPTVVAEQSEPPGGASQDRSEESSTEDTSSSGGDREETEPAWDSFPELDEGRHLAVAPDLDRSMFESARECTRDFDESRVGAEYYAAAVEVTARSGEPSPKYNDAVPYVDALYARWHEQGDVGAAESIVIVMGLENRAVAVHPGDRWEDLGFGSERITRTIDESEFASLAEDDQFGAAICELVEAIDLELKQLQ